MAQLKKFGTFGGVFTPSILTILGVIMYLRLPMIVGTAGLWATIGIIVIAHVISVTTGLSVSSIATDKKVQAGGTYFMISRSLGLPIGGTLGLALFVGLSFSVSLYIIGFSESFLSYWGWEATKESIRITGSIALFAVTVITIISTSLALKMQFFIMAAIVLSLISIFAGSHEFTPEVPSLDIPAVSAPLMVLFAIFFPAVTGFEAGVSMSGDLQDPKKSIPRGTIWAIIVGLVVYILLAVFFAYTVEGQMLATDGQVLLNIAWVPELVIAGIWGATISSALGSILGAPRILQATAVDNIVPAIFAKGVGNANEPRNALLLTFVIAEAGILIGELDIIARVVSIFFITTYGFLNLSATFESWTSADYRPEFKIPIWISALGALACFIVMIQLDFRAMLGAILLLGLVYFFLKRKQLALDSGDAWSGIWASLVKSGLERLNTEKLHTRNWRPNILMFSGSEQERVHMVEMGQSIAGRLGMLTGFEIVSTPVGTADKGAKIIASGHGKYFFNKYYSQDPYEGMDQVARLYGFSGVTPNTILMGWTKKEKNQERFAGLMRSFRQSDYNTVFLQYPPDAKYGNRRTIDLWWNDSGRNLSFAINLIRHITHDGLWKTATIRLMLIISDPMQTDRIRKAATQVLGNYRVHMNIRFIDNSLKQLSYEQIIQEESQKTDLTIIGIPDKFFQQQTNTVVERYQQLLSNLGAALLIYAASTFEELDLGFQEKKKEQKQEGASKDIRLPALPEVRNAWLNQDLLKIDARNQVVLKGFYEKTFVPCYQENVVVLQELKKIFDTIYSSLARELEEVEEQYRRSRILEKAKNELAFRTRTLLEKVKDEYLSDQQEALQNGIIWYDKRLTADIERFPQKAAIVYGKENLRIESQDRWAIRFLKLYSRFTAWLLRRPASRYIRYREVASYYLRDNRYTFLSAMLSEWQLQELSFFTELRAIVIQFDQRIGHWEKNAETLSVDKISDEIAEAISEIDMMETRQLELQKLWLGRMQVEYRRNLRSFAHTLETFNGPSLLKKRRSAPKVYDRMAEEIRTFSLAWQQLIKLQLNTELLHVHLQTIENRVAQEFHAFSDHVLHTIDKQYIKPLDALNKRLQAELLNDTMQDNTINSLPAPTFQQDLFSYYEDASRLADHLPETIDINYSLDNKDEVETVRVPVQRLTNYWLESTFYLPLQNRISEADHLLQRTSLTVRDILRLTNLHAEHEAYSAEEMQAVKDAGKVVQAEKEKLLKLKKNLSDGIHQHLQKSFESLTTHDFVTQAGDIGGLVRALQSQQVRTKVDRYQGHVRQLIRNTGTNLLYSKSRGILLAKQLTEAEENVQSHTARVLSFVEKVTPRPEVTKNLPFYYHNLFTGKSDISSDFWIERTVEMAQAEKAINRQRSGYGGGIMLLGERNTGKTALSWRVAKKFTRSEDRIFQIYPPVAGSIQIKELNRAFRHATSQQGNTDQIMRALPVESVVIINDLEMWWERTADGMVVVQEIMRLIRDYGQKYLFIINTNAIAYHLINELSPVKDYFLTVIPYRPFTTEEIERLILLRHWSGGMKFMLNNQEEDALSSWKKVQFFNRFFDYSGGNPGVALGAWLTGIEKVSGKHVYLRYPQLPNTDALRHLPDDWIMVIVQFLLHKRLSLARLVRILNTSREIAQHLLQDLIRAGLLVEKNNGVFQLNVYTEIHLINLFKEQEIL